MGHRTEAPCPLEYLERLERLERLDHVDGVLLILISNGETDEVTQGAQGTHPGVWRDSPREKTRSSAEEHWTPCAYWIDRTERSGVLLKLSPDEDK